MNAALLLWALAAGAVAEPSPPPNPPQDVAPEIEVEPVPEPEVAQGAPVAPDPDFGKTVVIELRDGQLIKGKLLERNGSHVAVVLSVGAALRVPLEAIAKVTVVEIPLVVGRNGELWVEDPGRSQYFFAHSAMLQKRGEWSLSVKELSSFFVSFGLFDFLTAEAGTVVPLYVLGAVDSFGGGPFDGLNFYAGVRGGGKVLPWLHLSTGLQALVLPMFVRRTNGGFPLGGLLSGTLTVGSRDRNVTLTAGMPFSFIGPDRTSQRLGPPLFNLSGTLRISRRLGLMTENWLYLELSATHRGWVMVNALGVRILGERFSAGLGLMVTSTDFGFGQPIPFPLPLVDLTWHFF